MTEYSTDDVDKVVEYLKEMESLDASVVQISKHTGLGREKVERIVNRHNGIYVNWRLGSMKLYRYNNDRDAKPTAE